MKDPRRLVEGNPDSLESRVLMSASADRASPASQAAAWAAFSATLSIAAHGGAATGASVLVAKSAWTLYLVKGVVGGVLAAATCVGAYTAIEASLHPQAAGQSSPSTARGPRGLGKAQAAAPVSSADAVGAPTLSEPVVAESTYPGVGPRVSGYPYAPRPSRSAEVRQPESESLTREVALLRQARLALAQGDARAALAAIDRRDREFPQGSLGPEATLLRVEGLVRAGDRARAKLVASSFLRSQPRGPHADRMRALLGENKP